MLLPVMICWIVGGSHNLSRVVQRTCCRCFVVVVLEPGVWLYVLVVVGVEIGVETCLMPMGEYDAS